MYINLKKKTKQQKRSFFGTGDTFKENVFSYVNMAIAIGNNAEEQEVFESSLYTGVGCVNILAVNPTKEELDKLRGFESKNEPVYSIEKDGEKTQIITFLVRTNDNSVNNGIETFGLIKFFLRDSYMLSKNGDKVKVINKYGECAWLPYDSETKKVTGVPENMSWFTPDDVRPCIMGEEELTRFLKNYANTAQKDERGNKVECRIDNISKIASGDVKELKELLKMTKGYTVKVLFYVDKNYQQVLSGQTQRAWSNNYSYFLKFVEEAKQNGQYATSEFTFDNLQKYVLQAKPTEITNNNSSGISLPNLGETKSPEVKKDDLPF